MSRPLITLGSLRDLLLPGLKRCGLTAKIDFIHGRLETSNGELLATADELYRGDMAYKERAVRIMKLYAPKHPHDIT